MKYLPKVALLLLISSFLTGMTVLLPISPWTTIFDYKTQMDPQGIPLSPPKYNIAPAGSAGAADFNTLLNYVLSTLPEGKNQSSNALLFPELQNGATYDFKRYNVILDQAADVEISFVYEGAGYRNSLGYFTFNPDSPPTRSDLMTNVVANKVMYDGIIFPNASLFNSGGSVNGLYLGDSLKVTFDAQKLASYSWNAGKDCTVAGNCKVGVGFVLIAAGYENFLDNNGVSINGGVRSYPDPNWVYYSLSGMNPEINTQANPDINQHMVLLNVPNTSLYALAFEDMNRTPGSGCDHDFNDVVYRLNVNPITAFTNRANIYSAPITNDQDNDGVPDNIDEFPYDIQRASSVWYPSKTTWNTLAFEDTWPSNGDFDMNDLVVNYRYRTILRADGKVKELQITYELMASGAVYDNGFAVELTGIPKGTTLDSATISSSGATPVNRSPETNSSNMTFRIFGNALSELGGGTLINTVKGQQQVPTKLYQLNVVFNEPVSRSAFTFATPFNPFLFRNNDMSYQVHLPGYPPTTAASNYSVYSKFGTLDDNSSVAAGRYYVSKLGYPWALDIPAGWKWPVERTDIVTAYPYFKPWAVSGGYAASDWYKKPSSSSYIYP